MSVDALDLDPDKLPAVPDPQVAGPAVDPALTQAQVQAPAQAAAQAQGAIARRPYVPDFVNKPGAQRSQDARAAGGSSVASGARAVADFAQSLPVAMMGSGATTLMGGNPAEALAHSAQLAEIAATANAQRNPMLLAAHAEAKDQNRNAKSALSNSMEAARSADSGKVGDKTIDEILADQHAHTQDEVTIASQAKLLTKRRERNPGKTDAEALRATGSAGRFKNAARAVTKNVNLGVTGDAIGAKKIKELTPEQTMGKVVSPDLVQDGHVVSRDSRPQNSWGASISNFFNSLNPFSSRPAGNTATLTASEQAEAGAHEEKAGRWEALANQRLGQRKNQQESGVLHGGYTPEEFNRKSELKEQISSLEGTAKSEKAARTSWYRRSPSFNEQEQQRFDSWGTFISGQDERVKANQEATIAGHQSELDALEAAKDANLGQRSSNWRPWKSGAYHFTDEEQAKYDALKSRTDAIASGAQGRKLTSEEQQSLSRHREEMHEMEQVRDTGLNKDQRQKYSSLQTSIAATKNNALFGLTEHDITARHAAMSEQEEMNTTLETGLTKAQREELQKAKDEREEQRQFKKTGLTKVERENKAAAEDDAKGVYRSAAAKNALLDTHGGQAVRESKLPGGQREYRVGGLKHEGVTDEDTKTTGLGWFAQAGRKVSGWLSFLGEMISGKSTDAKKRIQQGDLPEAAAISASGLTKEVVATGSHVALPGVGGKLFRNFTEGVGSGVKGVADASHAAFNAGAQEQDLRDEQGKLVNRERHEEASENAIDWHGAVAHDGLHTAKNVTMGLGRAALGAASAYGYTDQGDEVKQNAIQSAKETGSSLWAKAKRAVGLTPHDTGDGTPLEKGAEKFAVSAVTDNAMGIGTSAHRAMSAKPAGPDLATQIDSAQSRTQLEQDRAAARATQDAAPTRAADNLATRDSRRAANNLAALAELPGADVYEGAQPQSPVANAEPNASPAVNAIASTRPLNRRGSTAGSYNPAFAQLSGDEELHPEDMAGTSASYAMPSHDRSGSEHLEELHPEAMHDRSSGEAVEELRAEDMGEEDIET